MHIINCMIKKSIAIICIIVITSIASIVSIFVTRYYNKKECESIIKSLNISQDLNKNTNDVINTNNSIKTVDDKKDTTIATQEKIIKKEPEQLVKDIIVSVEIIKQKENKSGKEHKQTKTLSMTNKSKPKFKSKNKVRNVKKPATKEPTKDTKNDKIIVEPIKITEVRREDFVKKEPPKQEEVIQKQHIKRPKIQTQDNEQDKIVYNTIVIEEE